MKASEVIKRYKAGERNFQGVNLRGQSFRGENLSGADFSGADFTNAKIQGTKFTKANLIKANFTGAKCGRTICSPILWFLLIGFFYIFFNSLLIVAIRNFSRLLDFGVPLVNWLSLVLWFFAFFIASFIGLKKIDKILVKETENSGALVMLFSSVGAGTIIISIILGIIDSFTSYTLQSDIEETLLLYGTVFGSLIILLIAISSIIIKFVQEILPEKIIIFILLAITAMIIALVAKIIAIEIIPLIVSGIILLTTIYLGWNTAKDTKRESWLRFFAVAVSSWDGTSFYKADLTDAIFTEAKLKNADFRKANLTRVCWFNAQMLNQARIENTYLDNLSLLQVLTIGEGQDTNFDFQDLQGINFQQLNLSKASFIKADLSGADLTGATLTGACIEDWRINNKTNLKDVICDYVYLKDNDDERIPYDKNRKFKPGEFAKYVEKALNTVDLIFTDGIDWNAFLTSFKNMQDQYGTDEIGIQAIEKKPSGAFVIRVEVPPDINKAEIEKNIKVEYEIKLAELEKYYKQELDLKDRDIEYFKAANIDLREIAKSQAKKEPTKCIYIIDTYYEQKGENNTVSDITQTHSGSGDNVAGNKNITNNYNHQDLMQAAREIHQLLEQLSKTYPITETEGEIIVAGKAKDQIENNPTLKAKTINALKSAGKQAFQEAIDHPLASILMSFIDGWQDAE